MMKALKLVITSEEGYINMFLNHTFTKNGYDFRLVKSQGDIYMYERVHKREDWMDYEPQPHWEVVRVIQRKPYPNSEELVWTYPSASDWGRLGFTLCSRDRAEEKFNELI